MHVCRVVHAVYSHGRFEVRVDGQMSSRRCHEHGVSHLDDSVVVRCRNGSAESWRHSLPADSVNDLVYADDFFFLGRQAWSSLAQLHLPSTPVKPCC